MGLDSVELIMEVEDEFGIKIDNGEAGGIRTVGDMLRIVREKVGHREDSKVGDEALWDSLRAIIAEELRIPVEEMELESRFVEDLNMD